MAVSHSQMEATMAVSERVSPSWAIAVRAGGLTIIHNPNGPAVPEETWFDIYRQLYHRHKRSLRGK
jgi:hypothetical protein